MAKRKHVPPEFVTGNPHAARNRVQAVQGRRRSNAAGRHNPIPRKFRTRTDRDRAAVTDQER